MRVVLAIVLFCSVLLADRDGGPYVGLGYGISQFNDDGVYKEQSVDDSASLMVYGGAYINKHLSVEIAFVDFNVRNDYIVVDDFDQKQSIDFSTINVSTLAHYAFFDDILDFYAKFGVGQMQASAVGSNGFTMLYGGGVGVRFSEMFSMKIAYDSYLVEYTKGLEEEDMKIDFVYTALEVQF